MAGGSVVHYYSSGSILPAPVLRAVIMSYAPPPYYLLNTAGMDPLTWWDVRRRGGRWTGGLPDDQPDEVGGLPDVRNATTSVPSSQGVQGLRVQRPGVPGRSGGVRVSGGGG